MENSVCKKISAMLSFYIEKKLSEEENETVEEHLRECPACREKYVKMHAVVKNLRSSYEQMLLEFEKIERQNEFSIREHEIFYSNISSYMDDELSYSESVRFRKYLLKSKSARKGLADAYSLKNAMNKTFNKYSNNLKINFSKDIVKELKKERKETIDMNFKRASLIFGVFVACLAVVFYFVSTTYNNRVSSKTDINPPPVSETYIPDEITPSNQPGEENNDEMSDENVQS